jgi:hypothetical protein
VETPPVAFQGRLYRCEYVRDNYPANRTGASHFRLLDVAAGQATPAFARGWHLGCAFVEGETVYGFGVGRWGGPKVTAFWPKDLEKWEERLTEFLSAFRAASGPAPGSKSGVRRTPRPAERSPTRR